MNSELFAVITPATHNFIAIASAPIYGFGKVNYDQNVIVKLSAYPYLEYGALQGKITYKSNVAVDSLYQFEISLTNGLKTSRNKHIPPQAELKGVAEILTNQKTILQRLYEKIIIANTEY
ncbi:MAG: hypothetical protein QM763_10785 [Agriterribacter sp.]